MATWLTVNIILSALFFGAMVGIPLWMVIKRPDPQPDYSDAHAYLAATAARPAAATLESVTAAA